MNFVFSHVAHSCYTVLLYTLGTASLSCLSSNINIDISGSSISSGSQASVELAVNDTAPVSRVCDVVNDRRLLIYASNYTCLLLLL